MGINSKTRIEEQFKQAAEFINEVGMCAFIMAEEDGAPAISLLIGLPDEIDEGHYVVCNYMEFEESEDILADYYQLFYEIPVETGDLNEISLLKAVNEMNSVSRIGHFISNNREGKEGRIYLRYTFACYSEEELDAGIICELVDTMLDYALTMEKILINLASGIEFQADTYNQQVP